MKSQRIIHGYRNTPSLNFQLFLSVPLAACDCHDRRWKIHRQSSLTTRAVILLRQDSRTRARQNSAARAHQGCLPFNQHETCNFFPTISSYHIERKPSEGRPVRDFRSLWAALLDGSIPGRSRCPTTIYLWLDCVGLIRNLRGSQCPPVRPLRMLPACPRRQNAECQDRRKRACLLQAVFDRPSPHFTYPQQWERFEIIKSLSGI